MNWSAEFDLQSDGSTLNQINVSFTFEIIGIESERKHGITVDKLKFVYIQSTLKFGHQCAVEEINKCRNEILILPKIHLHGMQRHALSVDVQTEFRNVKSLEVE